MASLSSLYIKKETLETMLSVLNKKSGNEAKGITLTVSLSDEANTYGQNVSAWLGQTKEQIQEKKDKYFVGNGNTFWTKGETPAFIKSKSEPAQNNNQNEPDDLPF